jgi:hypothetical protein
LSDRINRIFRIRVFKNQNDKTLLDRINRIFRIRVFKNQNHKTLLDRINRIYGIVFPKSTPSIMSILFILSK